MPSTSTKSAAAVGVSGKFPKFVETTGISNLAGLFLFETVVELETGADVEHSEEFLLTLIVACEDFSIRRIFNCEDGDREEKVNEGNFVKIRNSDDFLEGEEDENEADLHKRELVTGILVAGENTGEFGIATVQDIALIFFQK